MVTRMEIETSGHHASGREGGVDTHSRPHSLKEVLEGVERNLILTALQKSRGNKAKAARALGITERLIGIRVKRLGIDWRGLRARRKHPAEHTA